MYIIYIINTSLNHILDIQTFDVIAISESRIKSNMDIATNINLPNYSIE